MTEKRKGPRLATSKDGQLVTFRGRPILPIMSIDEGEELVGVWVTPDVPGVGFYKLIAKRLVDGRCEWVHFTQRANGTKDKFYRGTLDKESDITRVISAINKALATAYGPEIRLWPANDMDIHFVDGVVSGEEPDRLQ